ncbi:Hypothetical Protein FCC1311_004142 [Hondaea fermentalgiana]|uniref:Uncharacterized protein n=1 Tax=Hondaea fermentalgiana TaxID=2315210 RepID=A0A2R5FZK6_9STRA|nr:Hypothetical Protein FCC1311_004142 [Hondaea fermentalgiana]|eukprot:GBG24196.1 Hypothetical Protein FCC1311_004142 [Hondaea fermentalgiana]
MQRRKAGALEQGIAGGREGPDSDEEGVSSCSGGGSDDDDDDDDNDEEDHEIRFGNQGLLGRASAAAATSSVAAAKPASGISIKVIVLLFAAAFTVFLGFQGAEKLIEIISADDASDVLEPGSVGAPGFSSQLEDDDDEDGADDGEDEGLDYPQRLHAYYQKHNPQLLGDVPMILARYAGNEKELFAKLEKKYGDPVLPARVQYGAPDGTGEAEEETDEDTLEDDDNDEGINSMQQKQKTHSGSVARNNRNPSQHAFLHNSHSPEIVDVSAPDESMDSDDEDDEDPFAVESDDPEDSKEWQNNGDGSADDFGQDASPDADFNVLHEIDDGVSLLDGPRNEASSIASRGKVKVIGVGFPGTGIDHVHRYIKDGLQWETASRDEVASTLRDIMSRPGLPGFDKFDAYEAVVDDTTALFFEELMATYPKAKIVLTVRPVDEWYESFKSVVSKFSGDVSLLLRQEVYEVLLGNLTANEFVWKKQYQAFYHRALHIIPRARRKLLCAYAEEDDRWDWLGRFLTDAQHPGAGPPLRVSGSWRAPRLLPSRQLALLMRNEQVSDPLSKVHELSTRTLANTGDLGALRVIGAGLDATGGAMLAQALKKLGLKVASQWYESSSSSLSSSSSSDSCSECRKVSQNLHRVLTEDTKEPVNFGYNGIFHGVDAIVGSPASMLVQEAARFNPDAKIVLTVRNLDAWWKEMRCRMRSLERKHGTSRRSKSRYATASMYHRLVFGSEDPVREFLHKRRYRDHLLGLAGIAPERILVIDLTRDGPSGDAWRQLCRFLRSSKCTPRLEASSFPSLRPFCGTSGMR